MKTTIAKIKSFLKSHLAWYVVTDDMGTTKYCWTLEEAYSWLPYCGHDAVIHSLAWNKKAIAGRTQYV